MTRARSSPNGILRAFLYSGAAQYPPIRHLAVKQTPSIGLRWRFGKPPSACRNWAIENNGPSVPGISSAGVINSTAPTDGEDVDDHPAIATDCGGNWVVIWESKKGAPGDFGNDYDISVSYSKDDGLTWSDTAGLNNTASFDGLSDDRFPEIAADGRGNWVAVWESTYDFDQMGNDDYDIVTSFSSDIGQTWSPTARLNSTASIDGEYDDDEFARITTDGKGHWLTVWESGYVIDGAPNVYSEILASRSIDNGKSWSAPSIVDLAGPSGRPSNNFYPDVATDSSGNWVVVWITGYDRDELHPQPGDVAVELSTDEGKSWANGAFVNSAAYTFYSTADTYPPCYRCLGSLDCGLGDQLRFLELFPDGL